MVKTILIAACATALPLAAAAQTYSCEATLMTGTYTLNFKDKRMKVSSWTVRPRARSDGSVSLFIQEEEFRLLPDGTVKGRGGGKNAHKCDLDKVRATM